MAQKNDPKRKTKEEISQAKKAFFSAPADMSMDDIHETDPFETMATVVPGKEPFVAGAILWGKYLKTKRCYSEKAFTNPKYDETGRAYRDIHIMENEQGEKVGIFSVGSLAATLPRLESGTFLGLRYDGIAEKATKKGLMPPHKFTLLGKGAPIDVDWNKKPVIEMKDSIVGASAIETDTDDSDDEVENDI